MARQHLDTLRDAHPYRLDDPTVAQVIKTWEVTRDDLDQLFAEQGIGGNDRRAAPSRLTSSITAPSLPSSARSSRRSSPSPTSWSPSRSNACVPKSDLEVGLDGRPVRLACTRS
jgi:hypothetical protein